jgi:hypothetical protein
MAVAHMTRWLKFSPLLLVFLLISCASEYTRLSRMSATELHGVSNADLCIAYGQAVFGDPNFGSLNRAMYGTGNGQQVIDEVRSRNISCESERRFHQIDCSGLAMLSAQPIASNAFVATVQNRTGDAKKFKLVSGGIASEDFILQPGGIQSYQIVAASAVAQLAGGLNPGSGGIDLANCVSVRQ